MCITLTKVDVVQTHVVERSLERWHDVLSSVIGVPELGGDEEVLSLDETLTDSLLDSLANLLLVTIVTGSVKESVTSLDGL